MNNKPDNTNFSFLLIWHENSLGVAVDQLRGDERISLTSYYYWPQSDAWSQIFIELKTRKWISRTEKIFLVDKTAEILNVFLEKKLRTSEQEENIKAMNELATDCEIQVVDRRGYY
jgi:30S ribosomal protein 3